MQGSDFSETVREIENKNYLTESAEHSDALRYELRGEKNKLS